MGARTDAARAAAVASRGELAEEVARLEAAGRAAVDIPAKIRRAPAKTASLAAGAAFVALGGPRRVVRRVARAVRGPEEPLPPSMLPDEVEKAVRALGSDGARVRGTLERAFAAYLKATAADRRRHDLGATTAGLAESVLGPITGRVGRRLAEELFDPKAAGGSSFEAAVKRARERWSEGRGTTRAPDTTPPPDGDEAR